MKTKKCQHIKPNGNQCNSLDVPERAKFCKPCAYERCLTVNRKYYHDNKKIWKPYTKNCKYCNAIIEINNRYQSKRKYCDNNNRCRARYFAKFHKKYHNKQAEGHRKSVNKKVPCICPRCESKHDVDFFYTGKLPARKFCQDGKCGYFVEHFEDTMINDCAVGYY